MIILRQNKMRKHNEFLWARQGNLSKHYFFLFLKHLVVLGGQLNANLTEKYRLSKPRML